MDERILFVDDEKFVLETFRRTLIKHFDVYTANSGSEALNLIESNGPFAVVVSDLKMPAMDGIAFLCAVKKGWPDTVRLMLTGQADMEKAIAAVNEGAIFRFLTKPCPPNVLLNAVTDSFRQYQLIMAERQLLHGTLRGCIQVLSELLSLVSPIAFGRAEKCKVLVSDVAQVLGLSGLWKFELAAMLSQIGCITLPQDILERRVSGGVLTEGEEEIFHMHPTIAGNLLRHIPRLEEVVEMVSDHELPLSGNPCVGARILKVVLGFVDLENRGVSAKDALHCMKDESDIFDVRIVRALDEVVSRRRESEIRCVDILDLQVGMVLMEPVLSGKGIVLMNKGQQISFAALQKLKNFKSVLGIKDSLYVLVKNDSD